jgi:pyruvate carboxylase
MERGADIPVELEPGKTLVIKFLTVGEPHPDGTRTVFFELNGQPREVTVRDKALDVKQEAKPKADPKEPGQIGAPIPGVASTIHVQLAQQVNKGDRLLVLEAMKMQSTIYSPVSGKITQLLVSPGQHVEAKELLLTIE